MPVKTLSYEQSDLIYDIIDGNWSDYGDVINQLNHAFAKIYGYRRSDRKTDRLRHIASKPKTKRKLNDWQKFVKANSKKKMFRYRDGKINLKKLGVAYRKKKRR